jgi:hypothetical protein
MKRMPLLGRDLRAGIVRASTVMRIGRDADMAQIRAARLADAAEADKDQSPGKLMCTGSWSFANRRRNTKSGPLV